MSLKVTSAVWQYSKYSAEKLLVLLALGDWADDDGYCWPSYAQIAEKSRITERGAIGIIQDFRQSGVVELIRSGGGRGNRPLYRIKGESHSSFNFLKGEREPSERVNEKATKGERDDIVIRNRQLIDSQLKEQSGAFQLDGSVPQKKNGKATRIPEDFAVTDLHRRWAKENSLPSPDFLIDQFRDHWTAKPGRDATKLDWDATFRNWIRNSIKYGNGKANGNGKADIAQALRDTVHRMYAEDDRSVPD